MRSSLPALILGLTVAACAAPPPPSSQPVPAGARQCFAPSLARGYRNLGEETLLLRVGVDEVWRLDFEGSCPNVRFALGRIALQQRIGGQVCQGYNADVVFDDAGMPRRCLVERVRRLPPAEVAALTPGERP